MHVALELSGKGSCFSFEGREAREGCGCNEVDQIRTTRSAAAFTDGAELHGRGAGGARVRRREERAGGGSGEGFGFSIWLCFVSLSPGLTGAARPEGRHWPGTFRGAKGTRRDYGGLLQKFHACMRGTKLGPDLRRNTAS